MLGDPIYAGLVNRVRLAGGVPRFVPAAATAGGWELDPGRLAAAVGPQTAAVLMMGPSMPTGLVLDERHWTALAGALERASGLAHLRRGDGAHPLRRAPAEPSGRAPGPGRAGPSPWARPPRNCG